MQINVLMKLKYVGFSIEGDHKNLVINFNRNHRTAGNFMLEFSIKIVVVKVTSQLTETSSGSQQWDIKLHGQVSGTGVLR